MNRGLLPLLACALSLSSSACGDDSRPRARAAPPAAIRVPADDAANWPPGDWQPVDRAALEGYLARRFLPPSGVGDAQRALLVAKYAARFDAGALQGTCVWSIVPDMPPGSEVLLYPLSLRLSSLAWPDAPAVWGALPDGRSVLMARPAAGDLTADWELPGQRIFDEWVFAVEIPLSGSSELTFDLPQELRLQSSGGIVSADEQPPAPGRKLWRVQAGRRTSLRITCGPAAAAAEEGQPLVRESHAATLQGEGIDLITELELAAGGPAEIQWETPASLQIVSASIGSDAPSRFKSARWTGAIGSPFRGRPMPVMHGCESAVSA